MVRPSRASGRACFAAVALAFFFIGGALRPKKALESVKEVKGAAFAEAGASRRALAPEAPVLIGDHVGTGPALAVTMLLGQDTTLRLGERGSVVIERFLVECRRRDHAAIRPADVRTPRRRNAVPVQIRSSYGLIAVRGTRLFAGPDGDGLGVFVERGEVSVTAAGRRVQLRAGKGTTIPRSGAAPHGAEAMDGEARSRRCSPAIR